MREAVSLRVKPLDAKKHLPVYRAWELPDIADEQPPAQRAVAYLESGLQKGEEVERHLQAAISASDESARDRQTYIPTPDATHAVDNYLELYRRSRVKCVRRVTFSRTVEECIGTSYCMDEDDEAWLAQYNEAAGRVKRMKVSEDVFEAAMSIFERHAAKQVEDPA